MIPERGRKDQSRFPSLQVLTELIKTTVQRALRLSVLYRTLSRWRTVLSSFTYVASIRTIYNANPLGFEVESKRRTRAHTCYQNVFRMHCGALRSVGVAISLALVSFR